MPLLRLFGLNIENHLHEKTKYISRILHFRLSGLWVYPSTERTHNQ